MSNYTCPHCGGSLSGDGYTTPVHCERITPPESAEPDSGPHFCNPNED